MKGLSWPAFVGTVALAFGGSFGTCARGQEPEPLPLPNTHVVTNGTIHVMARQPDGGVIVGGEFDSINGMERRNLARILPDGQLDPEWNPGTDGAVRSLAVDSDGSVFVAGSVNRVGGLPRRLAKIAGSGTGTVDPVWNPVESGTVYALTIDSTGSLLIGGVFIRAGGADRRNIARLATSGTGAADPLWNPGANDVVAVLAVAPSGRVYAGGNFSIIGGVQRARMARLSGPAAVVDPDWNPSANDSVWTIVVAPDETVFAAGAFSSIGGQARNRLARISAEGSGAADAVWNPSPNGTVHALALHGSSSLLVGGEFSRIANTNQAYVASLLRSGSGSINASLPTLSGGWVRALLSEADGSSVLGGSFSSVSGVQRLSFARLTSTGALRPAIVDVETPARVSALARQPDGGLFMGGNFFKVDQQPRRNLARLRADGTVDAAWRYDRLNSVLDLAVDAAGDVYVASVDLYKVSTETNGAAVERWRVPFSTGSANVVDVDEVGGVYVGGTFGGIIFAGVRNCLAKIDAATGQLVQEWDARLSVNGYVKGLKATPMGELYVSGYFSQAGGEARSGIARLDRAGNADTAWNPGLSSPAYADAFALAEDGTVYVGGAFAAIGGVMRRNLARFSPTGEIDMDWAPVVNGEVNRLALDSTGWLYFAGAFTTVNGAERRAIAKLQATGIAELDPLWAPEVRANESIDALAIEETRILVGGKFSSISGADRDSLAALPLTVPSRTTSTTATIPVGDTVVGQPYAVLAHVVADAGGVPTGHVLVEDGSGRACGPVVLVDGSASCTLTAWEVGGYLITVTYVPDTGTFAASDATMFHAVNRADTMLSVVGHAPQRSVPGQSVTITASLAVADPGSGVPTGSVGVGDGVVECTIAEGGSSCSLALHTRGQRILTATYAGDANYVGSSAAVEHLVNRLPTSGPATFTTYEDVDLIVGPDDGLLADAVDPDGDIVAIADSGTFAASGIGGTVTIAVDGSFSYVPPPGTSGMATFAYRIGDGYESVEATATVTVAPINHAPSFTLAADPQWPAGAAGSRQHPGFAQVTSFGPPDEAGQQVQAWHLRMVDDADGVVSAASIALDGALSYVLTGRTGVATLGVRLQDDGGTANGGNDTSPEQTFSIHVARGLDLSVSIVEAPFFVAGGGVFESTFLVRNAGPDVAVGARVRSLLPFNLVDAHWTCVGSAGGDCAASGDGDIDELVTIPVGGRLDWHLVATVLIEPEADVLQSVSVIAPADRPDMDGTNDSANSSTRVGLFIDGFDNGLGEAEN